MINKSVIFAPLVLLSAVDHYNRSAKGSKRRVVGVLLGQYTESTVRVTNSFAVPFEEDGQNPEIWFLDHDYVNSMNEMFKKINAKEKLIGWYHTGLRLQSNDLSINELFKQYCCNPLLVLINVEEKNVDVPINAYFAIEEIKDDGTNASKSFSHVNSSIIAEEAEEIGVEHLLRDVRDAAAGTISMKISSQLQSLLGLQQRLCTIANYLNKILNNGSMNINHIILNHVQEIFNLLPNLMKPLKFATSTYDSNFEKAFGLKTNDQLMYVYLGSLIRTIVAFHDLIENKIHNREKDMSMEKDYSAINLKAIESEIESKKEENSDV